MEEEPVVGDYLIEEEIGEGMSCLWSLFDFATTCRQLGRGEEGQEEKQFYGSSCD